MTINWRILLGLCVVLVVAFAWLLIANANLRAHLAMAQTENMALHISNDNFKIDAEKQNRAVAELKMSADRSAQRAVIFGKLADVASTGYMADAANIAKQQSGSDACRAADALIGTYIREKK
jgi:hypothetical protein